jgi:prepilin-type N-terminal cleavage/methylation domain-containing protein
MKARGFVRRTYSGFTLIELLVVIAIIALLMAILMPALNRAKRQASGAACLSNMHQWSLFFSMYTQDNNELFPQGVGGVRGGGSNRWPRALRSYHKDNSEFLCCPMATKPMQDINGQPTGHTGKYAAWGIYTSEMGYAGWPSSDQGGIYGSYGINGWAANPEPGSARGDDASTKGKYWRTVNVRGQSRIPVLLGATRYNGLPEPTDEPPGYDGMWWDEGKGGRMIRYCLNRHDGFVSGLFMDWSVRRLGLKELWTFRWHRQYATTGPWTKAGGVQPSDWPPWMRHFKDY